MKTDESNKGTFELAVELCRNAELIGDDVTPKWVEIPDDWPRYYFTIIHPCESFQPDRGPLGITARMVIVDLRSHHFAESTGHFPRLTAAAELKPTRTFRGMNPKWALFRGSRPRPN